MMDLKKLLPFATPRQREYILLADELGSNTKAAKELGIDRRAVDRGIRAAHKAATEAGALEEQLTREGTRTLVLDIETAPIQAYLWTLWPRGGISTKQVISDWYVLGYSYVWHGEPPDHIQARSINQTNAYDHDHNDDSDLLHELWVLLNEADVIVAHNGDKFDLKKIKTRMLKHGMLPPSPYRTVDTLKICKREFGFTSNRLDFVCDTLFGSGKLDAGMDLWRRCVEDGGDENFSEMRTYNAMDVELLDRLYTHIRAWDRSHPVLHNESGDGAQCVCGSHNIEAIPDKFVYTNVSKFQLYRCNECGHNMRGAFNLRSQESMANRLVNAR